MNQDIITNCDQCGKICREWELKYSDINEYYDHYICSECYNNGA